MGGNNRRKKRHDDNIELTEQEKELEATYRNTIEKLKDAISCRLDFLWAHFLGIEDFTGKDCTFCHDKDEREDESVKKCPIRDNKNIEPDPWILMLRFSANNQEDALICDICLISE